MKRLTKSAWIKIIVGFTFTMALVVTVFLIVYPTLKISNYDKYLDSLKNQKETQGVQSLKTRNSDFVAWLDCEDVDISIPIVVAPNNDTDFYLDHDFDKASNSLGSPYQYSESTLGQSTNTTIVGHSAYNTTDITGRTVFQSVLGNLNNYVNNTDTSNFNYKIKIETLNETLNYQIFSSFLYNANSNCENQKKLFKTTNLTTQQEFDDYVNLAKSLSNRNYNQTANFGDKFITLYTCSYQDGYRIMIIAKQV